MMQDTETDEKDSSDDWEQIKNYVGGANRVSKHPLQLEQERIQRRKPQHLDEGGVAGDDLVPNPQDLPGYDGPLPQKAPIVPGTAPASPLAVPAQPAPVSAPMNANYDAQASQIMGGVTPDTIQRLSESLNKPSWRQGIGLGLTGMGDALSRAGGSNSDYERQYGERMQQGKEMQAKVPGQMAEAGKEQYGLSQTLQAKDPNSPYSKVSQNTYGPDLIKMGLTKEQVAKMPADLIGDLMAKKVTLTEALARINETGTYQQGMLENTRTGLENTARHERTTEGLTGREQAFKEDTEASKHWLSHPFKASEARSRLAGGSAGAPSQSFETEADAEAAHLPSGTVVSIGGRPARVK